MACVFLSYDHDDADRAAPIAAALEKAGHSVWWDRHIHGGAEYNSEIESAVERADAVIVLWSARSVRSAWVRDEAAEGRDQEKLVPVLIDPVKPPMGFRQYQTIDLTQRKGRRRSSSPAELLRAIEVLSIPAARQTSDVQAVLSPARKVAPMLLVALAAVAIAVFALVWSSPWSSAGSGHRVAVMANDDSPGSRSLAANLLVQLGSLQAADADVLHLVEPESGSDADLVFKAGVVGGSPDSRASLALIDNRSNTLLWSREFVQPDGNEADLRQQLAYSAGQVLRCATEAFAPTHRRLELPTLKLFLNGCADLSNLIAEDARSAVPTFRKVTEQAPTFAGAWSKLIVAEMWAYRNTGFTDANLRKDLQAHIDHARKAYPNIAEPALAEAWLQTPRPISGWMRFAEEAVAKDPNHAEALINRSTGFMHFGRMREAVEDARRAVQNEPLYPAARSKLIEALAHSGAIEAARSELREVERLWPGASGLPGMRFMLEFRYGDPKEAMRILQSGKVSFTPAKADLSFLQARLNTSRSNIEKAVADARNESDPGTGGFSHYLNTLGQFGRTDEAANALLTVDPQLVPGVIYVLFRPNFSDLRHDPRFMVIMKRFEVIPYWQETGKWPDFCSDPDLPYDCKKEAAKLGADQALLGAPFN